MSTFNEILVETKCPFCNRKGPFRVQFKFGDCWQHVYCLGDRVEWGGNDKGQSGLEKVSVDAIGGPCESCKKEFIDFEVIIERDILTKVIPLRKNLDYGPSTTFKILKK